jgi:hypothetical protein
MVLQTIPMFMMKGIDAIESMLKLGKTPKHDLGTEKLPTPVPEPEPNES